MRRKKFISNLTYAGVGMSYFGITAFDSKTKKKTISSSIEKKFFKISLAQWSIHKMIDEGKISPYSFAELAKKWGFEGLEYVNDLYKDVMNAKNKSIALKQFVKKNNELAQQHELKNLLIMIDNEGDLSVTNKNDQLNAIENHKLWIETAAQMGCHSIRINLFGTNNISDWKKTSIESLGAIADFAKPYDLNILVENHGYLSSNAKLLVEVINTVNKNNCGILPDFGNFCLRREGDERWDTPCIEEYDKYVGIKELMYKNMGSVSAKSYDFDKNGYETTINYERMMKILKEANFSGYIGVEYEGESLSEEAGTKATRDLLLKYV